MTITFTAPAITLAVPVEKRRPLSALWARLTNLSARIGLPSRLSRLSERQLRDVGLHSSDIDWLRCHGSSQDAATGLAIRAGQRAGNW